MVFGHCDRDGFLSNFYMIETDMLPK